MIDKHYSLAIHLNTNVKELGIRKFALCNYSIRMKNSIVIKCLVFAIGKLFLKKKPDSGRRVEMCFN